MSPEFMMARRGVIGLLAGATTLVLTGCGLLFPSDRLRQKITVEVETPQVCVRAVRWSKPKCAKARAGGMRRAPLSDSRARRWRSICRAGERCLRCCAAAAIRRAMRNYGDTELR